MSMNKIMKKKGMLKAKLTYNKMVKQYVSKAMMKMTRKADR